jgi:NTE family protein
MLQELVVNQGLDFQIIRGVSVGALNASFLAQASMQGDSLQNLKDKVMELSELWLSEIKGNHSVYGKRSGLIGIAIGADSIYSLEPLKRLIGRHLSLEHLRTSGRDFAVGTVSLVSGRYHVCRPDDDKFIEKLLASASIPVVFPFVDFESEQDVLVDGGVRNITPLSSAFAARPDEIYVLLTSRLIREDDEFPQSGVKEHGYERWDDNFLGTKVSGFDVLQRTVDILADEVYLEDIEGALHWNQVVDKINAVVEQASQASAVPESVTGAIRNLKECLDQEPINKQSVPLYVLAPRLWFGDENKSTEFSPALIQQAVEHGREIAADRDLWLWPHN